VKHALALLLLTASCGKIDAGKALTGTSKRTLQPRLQTVAQAFGGAVLARDYDAAYEMMASSYRQSLSKAEFLKSISRYRDHVHGELRLTVKASDDDPKELKNDAIVQMLVPEHLRGAILDEAILNYDRSDELGEGDGWVIVIWMINETGTIKILNYYQDD